ncbi:MAG: flavoprotein [Planctomycetota bacterium]
MPTESPPPLDARRVLVGVTGGIAAYKTAALVSHLVQAGADVRVVMTDAAVRFVAPLTFQSLSGHPVLTSVWDHDDRPDSQHVGLARWCDLFVVAPCTADTLAKFAAGLTPDPVTLTASALPAEIPLLLAPAMNADMWAHPVVQRNLTTLRDLLPNLHEVSPDSGWQACRTSGAGRMAQPETIFEHIVKKTAFNSNR